MCRNLDLRFLFLLSSVKVFFPFFCPFSLFFLSVLLSFLLLSNWFLFLSFFVFPLLFQHYFIPVSLAHVISSLAYPNLLGTKRLGCCCSCCCISSCIAPIKPEKPVCVHQFLFKVHVPEKFVHIHMKETCMCQ
jgi:hypothetical protein